MRPSVIAIYFIAFLFSCNNQQKNPDVSNIKISLATDRFERHLFDTTANNLFNYILRLQDNEPSFTGTYLTTILNVDPSWPVDTAADYVNGFIKAYRPVYDSTEKIFRDFTPYEKEITKGLQFVKYYFPGYQIPGKIITYIGPADGYGDILSDDALIVGLQHHIGKDFSLYKTQQVQQTYPEYLSNRFEPGYIVVNCMKNIVNDLYPEKTGDKPLVDQMVEQGKRLYLLSKFLPDTEEYKMVGFTKKQLEDAYAHEEVIWDLFVKNSYLQLIDKNIIKNYIGEGPKTPELGEGAPGNIGSFSGWQIVKKYMQKNDATTLQQLMNLDAQLIFQGAKYKP
ncbi:MAG: hypothetical protein H7Z13_15995 [Ferruginibacter sp.]|nr:hypothetical protein [Ferruginibacter sp.]